MDTENVIDQEGEGERNPSTQLDLPKIRPLPAVADYVSSEGQLDVIGYFEAGYKRRYPQAKEQKTIALSQGRTINFVASAKYGYPNTEDLDLLRGFEKICAKRLTFVESWKKGKLDRRPHLDLPVTYSTGEHLRASGKSVNDRNWKAVREWPYRQANTGIEGELYNARTESHTHTSTHFLRQVVTRGEKLPNGETAELHSVWPEGWWISNFYYYYTTKRDHALHQRLRKPIARNLYPFLDQAWYASTGAPFRKRYADLANFLGLTVHKHLSLIRQQLDPAHTDLQSQNFLASWDYDAARDNSKDWIITYRAGDKWHTDQRARKERQTQATQIEAATTEPEPQPQRLAFDREILSDQVKELASEIAETCGHEERNRGFYISRAVEALRAEPPYVDVVRQALSETRAADVPRGTIDNRSKYFSRTLDALKQQLGLPL